MRADFQQYYHLNIDHLGTAFELEHAIDLAFQLPLGSRTYSAVDPSYSWNNSEYLLADIAWVLRTLCWSLAGGKKTGQRQPERIMPSQMAAAPAEKKKKVADKSTYQSLLATPRKEVAQNLSTDIVAVDVSVEAEELKSLTRTP